MRGIPQGYFKSSQSTSEGESCSANKVCTTTAESACPAMKWSADGESYCQRIPIGQYVSGDSLIDCPGTAYNKKSSSC